MNSLIVVEEWVGGEGGAEGWLPPSGSGISQRMPARLHCPVANKVPSTHNSLTT